MSGKSRIELFGHAHKPWTLCQKKNVNFEKYFAPTVKYSGGSLMLWGCFVSVRP